MPGGKRQWRSSSCHLVQRSVPVANEPWASWPSGAGGEWNFAWKKITTKKNIGGRRNMTFWKSLEFRVGLDLGSGFVCGFIFKGRLWFPKNVHSKKGWASWTFPQDGLTTKKPTTQGTKMPRIQGVKFILAYGRYQPPFNYRKKSEIIRNHQKNAIRARWYPKQTFLYGCFNWMIPNHYNKKKVVHQTSMFKEGLFVRYQEGNKQPPRKLPRTKRTSWNAKCPIFLGSFTPKTSN